jgi:hypothetical protein
MSIQGGFMRRLLVVAATAVALSIPASVASLGIAGGSAFAGSTVSCAKLAGTIITTVTISKCTPSGGKGYKSASAPAASLATGGNLTWSKSGATTTIGDTSASVVTPNVCKKPAANTEYSFTGTVTAASTSGVGIPVVGDSVTGLACIANSTGKISIVKGTTLHL